MSNSLVELSNDINVLSAEIVAYKHIIGRAVFEVGRRLIHVKENDLTHGEFGRWLQSIDIDRTFATKTMKVVSELDDSKYATSHNLGLEVLYQISTLQPKDREQAHIIPSTGETKTVDEMTVRELREVKKELRQANEDKQILGQLLTEERNKPSEIEYVERTSDSGIEAELQRYKEMFGDISVYEDDYRFVGSSSKVSAAIQRFIHSQRKLIDEFAFLKNYSSAVDRIPGTVRDDYALMLQAMNDFVVDIATAAGFTEEEQTDSDIIDAEYREVH